MVLALAVLGVFSLPALAGEVLNIRVGKHPDRVRVVLESDAHIPFRTQVAADGRTVVLMLTQVKWTPPVSGAWPRVEPLTGYRFEAKGRDGRLELLAKQAVKVLSASVLPPAGTTKTHRVVIDLAASADAAGAQKPPPAPASPAAGTKPPPAPLSRQAPPSATAAPAAPVSPAAPAAGGARKVPLPPVADPESAVAAGAVKEQKSSVVPPTVAAGSSGSSAREPVVHPSPAEKDAKSASAQKVVVPPPSPPSETAVVVPAPVEPESGAVARPVEPSSAPQTEADVAVSLGRRAAVDEGDFTTAVRWFRRAAELGSPLGAFNAAEFYRTGKGVPQSFEQAAQWYERAARGGFAPAQFYLGLLLHDGKGVAQDRERALGLWRTAAGQGLPEARQVLELLEKGKERNSAQTPGGDSDNGARSPDSNAPAGK